MILVVLGTHELPFYRLLEEVESLKKSGFIKEDIIVQNGNTDYSSDVMEMRPFMSYPEMDKLFDDASLVITHAGTGSVTTALKKGKKVIAVSRLKKYGEHNDDHQLQLVDVFEEKGHILSWGEGKSLKDIIEASEDFEPEPFVSGKQHMIDMLEDYIDNI
ncbi:PssE/Cps14G family polysaccharide biosynthesis glycosyltransferase [Halobacillus salinus]|uniref:PssE/Cps14G family polysaccharide biosynthesis glycosyltransferase n=1 Tax=Halobacillus salinus TaxID=192814 RepID=UPI0009A63CEB|nr:PssE/Cps14G family polysaccharide biosynthesis glycosyltransferase [Halobacillus salinus]